MNISNTDNKVSYYDKAEEMMKDYSLESAKGLVGWINTTDKSRQVTMGVLSCVGGIALETALLNLSGQDEAYYSLLEEGVEQARISQLSLLYLPLTILSSYVGGIGVPLGEEILFRDIIQKKILGGMLPEAPDQEKTSSWSLVNLAKKAARVVGANALFSLSHLGVSNTNLIHLLSTFGMGMSFGITREESGLFSSIIAHSIRNIIPISIYTSINYSTSIPAVLQFVPPVIFIAFAINQAQDSLQGSANQLRQHPDYLAKYNFAIITLQKIKNEQEVIQTVDGKFVDYKDKLTQIDLKIDWVQTQSKWNVLTLIQGRAIDSIHSVECALVRSTLGTPIRVGVKKESLKDLPNKSTNVFQNEISKSVKSLENLLDFMNYLKNQ